MFYETLVVCTHATTSDGLVLTGSGFFLEKIKSLVVETVNSLR